MVLEKIAENDTVKWGVNLSVKLLFVLGLGFTALLWLKEILNLAIDASVNIGF